MSARTDVFDRLAQSVARERILVDDAALDRYSHDAWPVSVVQQRAGEHPHRPELVVQILSEAEVIDVVRAAAELSIPIVPRGLGSSVTGQPLAVHGGMVLDTSGLVGDIDLNTTDYTVTVGAGTRGSDLEEWLGARGYTASFLPQSLHRSTVGGWIASRASGQLSSRYGGIEDCVVGFSIVLASGQVVRVGQSPRASVGPDLRHLFIGSEGVLGVITEVTLKVRPVGSEVLSQSWLLPSVGLGLEALRTIYQSGLRPSLMRFYDESESTHAVPGLARAGCAMFLGFEGQPSVAAAEAEETRAILLGVGAEDIGPGPTTAWYQRRFDFSTVEKLLAVEGGYAETIEVAHLWSRVEGLYDDLISALAPFADEVLGHFSHVYEQGVSLYVILLGRAPTDEEAASRLAAIWQTAMEVTLRHGGELSHHHGAGLARSGFVVAALGSQHSVLSAIKSALDPSGVFNPGHLEL